MARKRGRAWTSLDATREGPPSSRENRTREPAGLAFSIPPQPGIFEIVSLSPTLLTVTAEAAPDHDEVLALARQLVRFNEAHRPDFLPSELTAWIREPGGSPLGGVLATHHWGWMHISHLWVPEHLRGQGFGRRLIEVLEAAAREAGCIGAHVDTFDFQARGFYEALGYTRFGSIEDYPPGGALHFLSKRL